jgi:hypothetical protein
MERIVDSAAKKAVDTPSVCGVERIVNSAAEKAVDTPIDCGGRSRKKGKKFLLKYC